LAKAASVGANTVNGRTFLKSDTISEALSAVTKVLKLPFLMAVSTMSTSCARKMNIKYYAILYLSLVSLYYQWEESLRHSSELSIYILIKT